PAAERRQLVGRRVAEALNSGELVTRRRVEPADRQIPADQRVYTLPVSAETITSVDLRAGDEIEVAVVTNKNEPDQARTEVILPRATIFRVDLPGGSAPSFAGPSTDVLSGGKTASLVLLVSESQFEALARAHLTGDVEIALLPAAVSS